MGAESDAGVLEEEGPCRWIMTSRKLAEGFVDVDLVDVDMGGAPEEVAEMPAEMQSVSEFKHPGRCDPVRPANCIAIGICSENDFRDGEGQPAKSTRREFKTVTRCFR